MLNVYSADETEHYSILNRMIDFDKEALRERVERAHSEAKKRAEKYQETIQQRIDSGELANIKFKCTALEGVPEEQIIMYSEILKPEIDNIGKAKILRRPVLSLR